MRKLSTTLMILGISVFVLEAAISTGALAIASILFFLFAHLKEPIRRKWVIAGMITGSIAPIFWWIGYWVLKKILILIGVSHEIIRDIIYWTGLILFPFSLILTCSTGDMPFFWLYYIGLAIINIGFYAGVFNLIGYIVEKIIGMFKSMLKHSEKEGKQGK